MIRICLLLSAVLYVTLLIAGEDRGQMRPGLAKALANHEEIREITIDLAGVPYEAPAQPERPQTSALPPVIAARKTQNEPAAQKQPLAQEKAVFTLAALPSLGGDRVARPEAIAAVALGAEPDVQNLRYVAGDMVNVRMGPSKDTNVVAKLGRGEAVTLVSDADPDWAEILIEGDGLQGYVAKRLLRAAP